MEGCGPGAAPAPRLPAEAAAFSWAPRAGACADGAALRGALLSLWLTAVVVRCSKRSEFVMWATEVKKVDIESLPKWEEKDMFRRALGRPRLVPSARHQMLDCGASRCATEHHRACAGSQDIHGGLQHGHAAAQKVLRPGRV